ncbi:MAG: glycosyltransferase family 4 protein [Candidatus Latescibacteria bacterium]|nr:glycosyltransferase family 4 protein [Candidatus Latescibacterota bacterium]
MKVVVLLDFTFYRTSDGKVWTPNIFGYSFWQRYLRVFDGVKVVAVVHDSESIPENWGRADGERVVFYAVPYNTKFISCLLNSGKLKKTFREIVDNNDAVICRVPSFHTHFLVSMLKRFGKPYGLEVTTDPRGFYVPGVIKHPLSHFLRWYYTGRLRDQCSSAYAVSYATEKVLQQSYPSGGLSTFYSNVELDDADVKPIARSKDNFRKDSFGIIFVGNLHNYVKAPDIMLKAASMCIKKGKKIRLSMIGDGRLRPEIEKMARFLSLTKHVKILGNISSKKAVFELLDVSDLFVMPSRTETIPRAMVEAMARGLPCIGSNVGGIPELLTSEYLYPPDDAVALADKIMEVIDSPERMSHMSALNIETATKYTNEKLDKKRTEFYIWIKTATENIIINN